MARPAQTYCLRHRIGLVLVALPVSGCVFFREAEAPMPVTYDEVVAPADAPGLAVMLPGLFDEPDDFVDEGVVAQLRNVAPNYGVAFADAHLNYYRGKQNTIVERLAEDVIADACRRGYKRIWMMGVSLGGFGSLLYASRFPAQVAGVVALAPYLGPTAIAEEVELAGGLGTWRARESAPGEYRFFGGVWTFLKAHDPDDEVLKVVLPTTIVGVGTDDSFAEPFQIAVTQLPKDRVYRADGGHDWDTWTSLFATAFKEHRTELLHGRYSVCP